MDKIQKDLIEDLTADSIGAVSLETLNNTITESEDKERKTSNNKYLNSFSENQTVGNNFHVNGDKSYFGLKREHNLFDNDGHGNAGLQLGMDRDKFTSNHAAFELQATLEGVENPNFEMALFKGKGKGNKTAEFSALKGVFGGHLYWRNNEVYHRGFNPTAADVGALPINGKSSDSSKLNGTTNSMRPNANTIAQRDGSGDINVRLLRSTHNNVNTISGAIAYRVNNSSDNYTRYCSDMGAVRNFVGVYSKGEADGRYLGKTAKAANADKIDGYDISQLMRRMDNTTDYKASPNTMLMQEFANRRPVGLPKSAYNYGGLLTFNDGSSRIRFYAPRNEGGKSSLYVSTGWNTDIKAFEKLYSTGSPPTANEIKLSSSSNEDLLSIINDLRSRIAKLESDAKNAFYIRK